MLFQLFLIPLGHYHNLPKICHLPPLFTHYFEPNVGCVCWNLQLVSCIASHTPPSSLWCYAQRQKSQRLPWLSGRMAALPSVLQKFNATLLLLILSQEALKQLASSVGICLRTHPTTLTKYPPRSRRHLLRGITQGNARIRSLKRGEGICSKEGNLRYVHVYLRNILTEINYHPWNTGAKVALLCWQ